ncbi:hypothetical protein [Fibrobacter intestinalis]|uniref:hypothetical protein n=1 Tax=Fibrobacter intestinalis TaxID=28122 RepID=UPI001F272ACD|nr:hypothetical protein [Fibrobacter intestinalis]
MKIIIWLGGAAALVKMDSAQSYLQILIRELRPGEMPNQSGFSIGLHYSDWSPWQKSEDFSYPGVGVFSETQKIPLFIDQALVAGLTPNSVKESPVMLSLVAIQPENGTQPAFVTIKNDGLRTIHLDSVFVKKGNGTRVAVSGDSLIVGGKATYKLDSLGQNFSGRNGELLFSVAEGFPVAYVCWGGKGALTDYAVESELWESECLKTSPGIGVYYSAGDFYRVAPEMSGRNGDNWLRYGAAELDKVDGELPDAEPISLQDGSAVVKAAKEPMHFAWHPVPGAAQYQLVVARAADSSIVFEKTTTNTQEDVLLDEGDYLWGVGAINETSVAAKKLKVAGSVFSNLRRYLKKRLTILLESLKYAERVELNAPQLAARKDTYLLDLKWGELALAREWDRPHTDMATHPNYDDEESYRCWAVGANILNRYYGGNLTQDEIKMYGVTFNENFYDVENPQLVAFLHFSQGAAPNETINEVLQWTLNTNTLNRIAGKISENLLVSALQSRQLIYMSNGPHIMTIDAYRKRIDGQIEIRLLNTDNNGTIEWRLLSAQEFEGFWIPDVTDGNVRMTDPRVHVDSDEDGMMDYDEIVRFHTNPNLVDSDGDGIGDKTEIMSYTFLEKIPDDSVSAIRGVKKEIYADIDGDGLRAELDEDSDNGGLLDGLEDINHNGIFEENEKNPFDEKDDLSAVDIRLDIPLDITIFANGRIRLNDYVKCYDLSFKGVKYCKFASNYVPNDFGIVLGVGVTVDELFVKSSVFIRNKAVIYGHVRFYTLPNENAFVMSQKDAYIKNSLVIKKLSQLWPFSMADLPPMEDVGQREVRVKYGEVLTLQSGDKFRKLSVAPGGTLRVPMGEFHFGELQMDASSQIEYVNPGYKSVFHVNGSCIWRAKLNRQNNVQDSTIARGVMLMQHGSETMFIEGEWAGTILAPNADLVLGQSNKIVYGRFAGKNVTVHQFAIIYKVPYSPKEYYDVALFGRGK